MDNTSDVSSGLSSATVDSGVSNNVVNSTKKRKTAHRISGFQKTDSNHKISNLVDRKITRSSIKNTDENPVVPKTTKHLHQTAADKLKNEFGNVTNTECIKKVQLGKYQIYTSYYSPYPKQFQAETIFVCKFCFKYSLQVDSVKLHESKCEMKQVPGIKIYNEKSYSIWEVDPSCRNAKIYCQNLCLLGKLFTDLKTVFFHIESFFFYILCQVDIDGAHLIGYFSKEKDLSSEHNLGYLIIMPPFQQRGFGKLLISFSYELSKLEGRVSSPEKPLSDFGKLSYQSYWKWTLLNILKKQTGPLLIQELSAMTCITQTDIIATLESLGLIKYWKNDYVICITPKSIRKLINSLHYKRPKLIVKRSAIKWTPKK